ncbi:CHAT domain-containing protein [Aureispira sp. CCB-E]|uniref:CHAT domain-containing protein n=1 Tax=Aureispira sp. CCB-E TaxID=3051121 RepID=UPI0028692C31|nr:CHAT domain-containing protein [Aureispira sp. CCB-E]WMX17329.1 CHAT domain-containing protein [Aureispira sp. CCB-E]
MIYLQKIFFVALLLESITLAAQRTTMTDFSLAYNLGAYNRAAALGEELLLRKSIQNDVNIWFPLSTKLGIAYHSIGNYTRGLERLDLPIEWAKTEKNYPVEDLLLAYHEKGKILNELEQYASAQFVYSKAVKLFENDRSLQQDSSAQIIYLNTLIGIGATAYSKSDYSKAKTFFEKALVYSKEVGVKEMGLLAQQHLYLGKVEEKLGNHSSAGDQMLTAIEMGKMEVIEQSVLWSNFYHDLANYYIEYKRNEEALEYNSLAIKSLLPTWKNEAQNGLPTIEELNQSTSLGLAAQLLAQRGAIFFSNKNEGELKKALENYRLMDVFVTRLRRLYTGESARLLWSDRALDFYEKAIKSCLRLYDKTGQEDYRLEAFELSERSKSLLLLEAFKKIKAKKVSGVPIEKIEKEEVLEADVDALENQLYNLKRYRKSTESYKNKLRKKEKELLEKKRMYEDFLIELRKQYPDYYKLKFDLSVTTVGEVQERLASDQLLIEYFITKNELIVFKISKQGYDVLELPLDFELTPKIKAFREGIYGYYLNNKERSQSLRRSYIQQYQTLGYELYQGILKPVLAGQQESRLMIILAGNLGFLPFEALLTAPTTGENFTQMPYLLNDYAIGYCYSATLLHEMQQKEHVPDKIFLGFAPEFKQGVKLEGKYAFDPLLHSEKEVKEIFDLVGMGEVFDGELATKENFQENCEDYCIVHIATHGVMNTENSENSFLAFSEVPDSSDNELLYVRDLYNMHLTASLVVLSACETGIGELYESEGIASLARGFSYAGAKSLITSLWSVNDHATAEIMRRLYANLKMGMPKDKALQQAKHDFIKDATNQTAHPFLWSAFIQIGDEAPLPSPDGQGEGNGRLLWILGGIALLLLGVGLLLRRSKKA